MGKRVRGCVGRLVGGLLMIGVITVPVALLLSDATVTRALGLFYSPVVYDLESPALIATWRWVLGGAAGVLGAFLWFLLLMVGFIAGYTSLSRAQRRRAANPTPLDQLRAAAEEDRIDDVVTACQAVAATAGDEAVTVLTDLLETATDPRAKQALASALYRLGRAVTADVSAHLPRR